MMFLLFCFWCGSAIRGRKNRQKISFKICIGWKGTVESGRALPGRELRGVSSGKTSMWIENIFKGSKLSLYLAKSCEWHLNGLAFVNTVCWQSRNNIKEMFFCTHRTFYPQTPPGKLTVTWIYGSSGKQVTKDRRYHKSVLRCVAGGQAAGNACSEHITD